MRESLSPKLSKWPFFLGDLLMVGGAGLIYARSALPLSLWQEALIVGSVAGGAVLAILPFLLEYRLLGRLVEAERLVDVVGQIRKMETIAEQITAATARWQGVQEVADRVAGTSKAIAERMSVEAKAFTEFLQKANDSEKANLRLEADKLRRSEADWVHVMVRMLDHVYALYVAAVRSGQPNLIAQMDQFQYACRDAARRIGLTPFAAGASEQFDAQRHQLLEGQPPPAEGAKIAETVATGYTFQGRLLRPALVRLEGAQGNGHGQEQGEQTGTPAAGV
ncbi:MAG TPA: nucleotide exchange factor GrpE [Verrucomicrobiae bacterium]|nr:nucleotide exchange factor GrpE [Verrucomicrobiae bacterium]